MSERSAIYSERCWIDGHLRPATITMEDGMIVGISDQRSSDAHDAGTDVVMPGIIDAHVHINEPGRTEWEGCHTATLAAAAGGITTVIDMPLNSSPVTTSVAALQQKVDAVKDKLHVNVGFYGGLVPGNQKDIEPLIEAGVSGIKCFLVHSGIDEFPQVNREEVAAAMQVMAPYGLPLLAHCELADDTIDISEWQRHPTSYQQYLLSRPDRWELDAIEMMIGLCEAHGCATHIVHVAAAGALSMIDEAKRTGLPLTAETCPHYILFDAEHIPDKDTRFKCAPPIRSKENNERLKAALGNGVLDLLGSDHSPAPPSIKELESGNLHKAWGGIAGLQFLLPASWTALKEHMILERFIPLLTARPAALIGADKRKGKIEKGFDADIVIWEPEADHVVKASDIFHRYDVSPYTGQRLYGVVKRTIVNGQVVYDNGQHKALHQGALYFREH